MNWKTAYLETRVLSADPVGLIAILYEYAILSVQDARDGLAQGDIFVRAKAITKTIAILGELEKSLDYDRGGEIASNLGRLYRYMREQLTMANIQQSDGPLAEVEGLLITLGEAWQQIGVAREADSTEDFGTTGTVTDWNAFKITEPMTNFGAHTWSA